MTSLRLIAKLALVCSALFLPFWITGILFFLSIVYFEQFYFALCVMFVIELLFGFQAIHVWGIPGAFFFACVLLFVIVEMSRRFLHIQRS